MGGRMVSGYVVVGVHALVNDCMPTRGRAWAYEWRFLDVYNLKDGNEQHFAEESLKGSFSTTSDGAWRMK